MQSNPPPKSRSYSMASQSSGSSPMSVRRPSQNPTSLFGWSQIQKSSSMYSSKRSLLPDHLNEAREVLQIHLLFMLLQVSTILTFGSTGGPPPFLWCDVTRLTAHVLTQLLHISNLCHSPALTQWGQSLTHRVWVWFTLGSHNERQKGPEKTTYSSYLELSSHHTAEWRKNTFLIHSWEMTTWPRNAVGRGPPGNFVFVIYTMSFIISDAKCCLPI